MTNYTDYFVVQDCVTNETKTFKVAEFSRAYNHAWKTATKYANYENVKVACILYHCINDTPLEVFFLYPYDDSDNGIDGRWYYANDGLIYAIQHNMFSYNP